MEDRDTHLLCYNIVSKGWFAGIFPAALHFAVNKLVKSA
jgi:hypothetical protein